MSHFFIIVGLRKSTRDVADVGDQLGQTSKLILAFSSNLAFLGSTNVTHVSIYKVRKKSLF